MLASLRSENVGTRRGKLEAAYGRHGLYGKSNFITFLRATGSRYPSSACCLSVTNSDFDLLKAMAKVAGDVDAQQVKLRTGASEVKKGQLLLTPWRPLFWAKNFARVDSGQVFNFGTFAYNLTTT